MLRRLFVPEEEISALLPRAARTLGKGTSVGKPTLVIVDDDTDFLVELQEVLCSKGYAVVAVSDPRAAVRVIEEAKPDAVMLDLRMDEKDGIEIAKELSQNPATVKVPVIAMTAYHTEEQVERLKSSSTVKSFLIKPLLISDVIAKLEEVRGPR